MAHSPVQMDFADEVDERVGNNDPDEFDKLRSDDDDSNLDVDTADADRDELLWQVGKALYVHAISDE